jgi:hypothetical protein
MQELRDPIKRPNLWIIEFEEGKEVQAKEKKEKSYKPNLEKELFIQIQKASRTPVFTTIEPLHSV